VSARVPARVWLAALGVALGIALGAGHASVAHAQVIATSRADADLPRVTVDINDVQLATALQLIARQVGLTPVYPDTLLPARTRVTLHLRRVPVTDAFQQALQGTGLVAEIHTTGNVVIMRDRNLAAAGIIVGRVTEAKSGRPIAGVSVTVKGTRRSVSTRDDGTYRLASVDTGMQAIVFQRLGYAPVTRPVHVVDGVTDTLFVALTSAATVLTDVVTTATGDRRRLEVGNDIGTIQADSIVPTTLIRNMSDLLQARVPGVVVSNASGLVGSPSKIRIRGVNSSTLNNDPIVILDGVRLNAQTTVAPNQTNTGSTSIIGPLGIAARPALAPSRLDDIDPNTIESIDVLRGPSASSLYGTDAANGVIVIKTKRGQAGNWHTDLSGDAGWSSIPGKMPDMWWGFGKIGLFQDGECLLVIGGHATVASGQCQQDSVRNFNYENDPQMTTLGTGTARSLGGTVSGGSTSLQQFFSLRATDNVGIAKMSDAQARLISRLWNAPAPSWMKRPNTEQDIDGSSRTTFHPASAWDLSLSASGIYRNVLNGGGGTSVPTSVGLGMSPSDTLGLLPSDQQRTRSTSIAKHGVASLDGTYRPLGWLSLTGTLGGDYTLRNDNGDLRAQDCTAALQLVQGDPTSSCPSGRTTRNDQVFVKTGNVGAELSFAPRSWLSLRTSIGENYNHTDFYSLQVGNNVASYCYLAFGTTLLTPGPVCYNPNTQQFSVSESQDQSATAGWYLEQGATLFGVYGTMGIRKDVSSGFGGQVNKTPPTYPKFDFSYPLSEQSFFPKQSWLTSLRLRLAYGQSGNVTSQTAVLNQYLLQQESFLSNGSTSPVIVLQAVGNPNLKPERGVEWEGGVDFSLFDNERIQTRFTMYRKYTRDQISNVVLPPSYGTESTTQYVNLGNVENRGTELSVIVKMLDTRPVAWDFTINASKTSNKLVHKASGASPYCGPYSQCAEGYPLFGFWGVPIASYADANHDGILEQSEIIFGPPAFMGAPYPKSELSYINDVSLFNGSLRVNANINQVNGQSVEKFISGIGPNPRGAVDPTAPLAEQAAWIQANVTGGPNNAVYLGQISYVRFNELSVTYNVPPRLLQRFLWSRSLGVTLAGRNLALWSHYLGGDPAVNTDSRMEEIFSDDGTGVPQPRNWTVRFNLGL